MRTKTSPDQIPASYDPSGVANLGIVVVAMVERAPNVVLVRRGEPPYEGIGSHRWVQTHQKTGNVVLTLDGAP